MHRKILNKPFRLNPSTVLFLLLLAVSIMCISACSSDSDNAGVQPNYIVQATVSVDDDGPVAYALVMDGYENLVSNLDLTINGDPMTIIDSDDGHSESTESGDRYSYYTLELPELKGGDMVVFEARDRSGTLIYAPEPAVIPMPIVLLDPREGQDVIAGEEVNISWTGGEGADLFSAAYAALDGSATYSTYETPGEAGLVEVPPDHTVPGAAICGVGAITGEIDVVNALGSDYFTRESYFIISRHTGIRIEIGMAGKISVIGRALTACPEEINGTTSYWNSTCIAEFAALGIGAIVWENRRQVEFKEYPVTKEYCDNLTNGALQYCSTYGASYGHGNWMTGCVLCKSHIHDGWLWTPCNRLRHECRPPVN